MSKFSLQRGYNFFVEATNATQLGQILTEKRLWIAVAESCTGGLVGHLITNVPGSSAYFRGGVIAYSNEIKTKILGVTSDSLVKFGAVSEQTVSEMAEGVRGAFEADIGLSISGIAGPDGGTEEKPVGTVWIGVSIGDDGYAMKFHFLGDREQIKQQAAEKALKSVIDLIKNQPGD
ncbi:MAG: CinA family protein [Chloroflexota bacterium]|nr:MAG: CinA family protein [Chloroflexota bacterium]